MGSSQKKIPFHRHREAEEARKKVSGLQFLSNIVEARVKLLD